MSDNATAIMAPKMPQLLVSRCCEQVGGRIKQFLLNASVLASTITLNIFLGALCAITPVTPVTISPPASYDLHTIDLIQRHFGGLDGALEHRLAAFHQRCTLFLEVLAGEFGEGLEGSPKWAPGDMVGLGHIAGYNTPMVS